MGPGDLIKSARYQSISGVKVPESLKCNFRGVINGERRVGSTHPAAVALAGALVHAEDADILTLSVQANLQQRNSHAGEERYNWFHDTSIYWCPREKLWNFVFFGLWNMQKIPRSIWPFSPLFAASKWNATDPL